MPDFSAKMPKMASWFAAVNEIACHTKPVIWLVRGLAESHEATAELMSSRQGRASDWPCLWMLNAGIGWPSALTPKGGGGAGDLAGELAGTPGEPRARSRQICGRRPVDRAENSPCRAAQRGAVAVDHL